MSGTKQGGLQAAKLNKQRYGEDFYKQIGRKGGQKSALKGFALDPDRASWAGKIGGSRTKRDYRTTTGLGRP